MGYIFNMIAYGFGDKNYPNIPQISNQEIILKNIKSKYCRILE